MKNLAEQLVQKSIEAFLLAIELYNKPTIKYRVEGFSLFIVNAWELMLKAYLIRRDGEESIYYKDNPDRSISLEVCIRKIFTNEKDPLRLNLERIIDLRNTSTHFITEEYEAIYVPLFQANVVNFSDKLNELHGVDITNYVPENFLSLTVSFKAITEAEIRGKYSNAVASKLLSLSRKIEESSQSNSSRFAINVKHYHCLTKKKGEATEVMRIAKDGEEPVMIINKSTDPTKTHPFTAKNLLRLLNERLRRSNVVLFYHGQIAVVNNFHFNNLCKHFGLKDNKKHCFVNTIYKNNQYSYSQDAIDFLFVELSRNAETILDAVSKNK